MRTSFVGVGEAFDETLPNCSALVESHSSAGPVRLLLDCGFSAPFSYWRIASRPQELDAVFISHFHGDHFFGLPALLLRFFEEERTSPLMILGGEGVEEKVHAAMDLAYPSTRAKFRFDLDCRELPPGGEMELKGLTLTAAPSDHSKPNLSLRVEDGDSTLFYSGDGRPTAESLALAWQVDLMIHESFSLDEEQFGHGTVPGSIRAARDAGAQRLALVHIRRDVRRERRDEILALAEAAGDVEVMLPEPGQVVLL